MKILVIGLGKSGRAACELLEKEGHEVVGVDDKEVDKNPPIPSFDLVVVSPGIPQTHRYYVEAVKLGKKVVGEAELAFSRLHQPCAAITGTNGKTTVTLLVEHVLKNCGKSARALGNVGTPLTSYLKETAADEIVVAELSSFQLETLQSAVFDVGVILNITPDHLDRYSSMEEYARAKCRLQRLMKNRRNFWVHQSVANEFGALLQSGYQTYGSKPESCYWTDRTAIRAGEKIETVLPIRYRNLGTHESENVLAAWLICKTYGVDGAQFSAAVASFQKPAHRIEFVTAIGGVDYYNDSKGTNIDATMKAVETMTSPVVLIAGGVDKGASYLPWKKVFAMRVKTVIAVGQAAVKIAEELKPEFSVTIVATLEEAVKKASQEAKTGDAVLLSPGCSSYDMFRDYAHRGDEFKKLVLNRSRE